MQNIFKALDFDGDGMLTMGDLLQSLRAMRLPMPKKQLQNILQYVSRDGRV